VVVRFKCVLVCAHLSFLWTGMNVEMDEIMVYGNCVGVCCLIIGAVVLAARGGPMVGKVCVACV